MRRYRKLFLFLGAAALALVITIKNRGQDITVTAHPPIQAAIKSDGDGYDLSQLPIFTRALFHVSESYFDKNRLNPKRMLVGALDFLQRDVPEVIIDREPERDPKTVTVTVNGVSQAFSLDGVNAPWNLRTKLKEIFRFIQPNLQPVGAREEAGRLVDIESAATNGMLYTLDPHSALLGIESFKEMRMTTQGKFGGLGIVIGMDRKNRIVVRKPMPGTPAIRAGMRARDHIARINDESTVNMTLTDAVERLRGDVGSTVDVYVAREGEKANKKFTIKRDFIRPPSIDPPASVLTSPARNGRPAAKIGFFRMHQFTANTEADLNNALALFKKERVKGIIMDLRGNPGGLYDQAQKVADAFIESGVLVSMVGVGGTQRRDEHASRGGDEQLPVAVLVNQNSASASEIVAGAMKNLDRGVVIGETTFGKGSVQMLFDVNAPVKVSTGTSSEDKLGLKLTTAQYLTAGDVSIQGVGVTPDIELQRLYVRQDGDESWINLQPSERRRQESDYEWHLENPTATKAAKPAHVVSYLYELTAEEKKRLAADKDDDEDAGDDFDYEQYDKLRVDFPIEFARDLLAQTSATRRSQILEGAGGYVASTRARQDQILTKAIAELGVDWSPGAKNAASASVELTLEPVDGSATVPAGETLKLKGTAKNIGSEPVARVHAVLRSANPLFDENEMVFGRLAPGQSKDYTLAVKVPRSMLTRSDVIRAEVLADGPVEANVSELVLDIAGKDRPTFTYSYQTIDDLKGNGDGRVQLGEKLRLLVTIKNTGDGEALKPRAALRNGPGQNGILITKGRFDRAPLAPGEVWPVTFEYEVGPEFGGDDYELGLTVVDQVLGESVSDKVIVKVAAASTAPKPAKGAVVVGDKGATLLEGPDDAALVIGEARPGARFALTGKIGAFSRVEVSPGRPAFVRGSAVRAVGKSSRGKPGFQPVWPVTPPLLAVRAPTVVTAPSVAVKGVASDDKAVRDVFIKVWNRDAKLPAKKVFYKRNDGASPHKLPFAADVPLWPGSNLVQVFVRETNEVQSVHTLVVRRADDELAKRSDSKAAAPGL